jgi:hypothetical protein
MSTLNGGPGNIVTNGLVLYLDAANHLSYTSGSTTWRDISESNHLATITSPVFTTEGGGGFTSGTTTYPIVTQNDPTQMTLEVTLRATTTVNFAFYVRYGTTSSAITNKISFRGTSGNGIQIFVYGNTTTTPQLIIINTAIPTTRIMNLSLDNLGVARLYINGILSSSNTIANFTSWQISTSGGDLGAEYYSNLKIYNRALTASEVLQNYNATKARFGL